MDNFLKFEMVYTKNTEEKIAEEFKRSKDTCYLDNAGTPLYSEKQIDSVSTDLLNNIYANPHSLHASGKSTQDHIDVIRLRILKHFNTTSDEYSIIFTSGATQSIKIVAETFDYGSQNEGCFVYLENNHTSVLGMRNYAKQSKEIKTNEAFRLLSNNNNQFNNELYPTESNSLFAFPAECNFSGTKYPLNWIKNVQNGALDYKPNVKSIKHQNWYVLLDAACFLSHETLNLNEYKPDFVVVSFYKIFGYPTGLGALLVRKCSEKVLQKKYFGGGTVLMSLSARNFTIPRNNLSERFEDGTLPYLNVLSLTHGFDTIKRLGLTFDLISRHTFNLSRYIFNSLVTLHHANGQPAVILYHDTTFKNPRHQGSIVNFNLLRDDGEYIGYAEVLNLANLHGIYLRTGCHCNPGGCQRALKLESSDVVKHFNAGHVCGDQKDLIDGQPTGTVRISFGYMSSIKNADTFIKFIEDCFVTKPIVRKLPENYDELENDYNRLFNSKCGIIKQSGLVKQILKPKTITLSKKHITSSESIGILQQIILYPVKSCGGFNVRDSWTVTGKGLKYDREWMIVNAAGVCLTQKQNKKLCLIKPFIDEKRDLLTLHFEEFFIDINIKEDNNKYLCQSRVCGGRVVGWDCGDGVSDWLSLHLESPGLRLLRQFESEDENTVRNQLSFANQAQYLLINSSTVEWLRNQVPFDNLNENLDNTINRFRPNFVVKFPEPHEEDQLDEIQINKISFTFFGKCTRCQMICIDQSTGNISKEPLSTLSKICKGKINFGIYLSYKNDVPELIKVGSEIVINKKLE